MKTVIYSTLYQVCILTLTLTSCKKDKKIELAVYHLDGLTNAKVQNAKCGIDLSNGLLYSIDEGKPISDKIDIAYGFMMGGNPSIYERIFLDINRAGCLCAGATFFSYGDDKNPKLGYSTYTTKNSTELYPATGIVDFEKIASEKTKSALDQYFPKDVVVNNEAFLSANGSPITYPYIFFKTTSGKRGVIKVGVFGVNLSANYQLETNPISIDIIVEL